MQYRGHEIRREGNSYKATPITTAIASTPIKTSKPSDLLKAIDSRFLINTKICGAW